MSIEENRHSEVMYEIEQLKEKLSYFEKMIKSIDNNTSRTTL